MDAPVDSRPPLECIDQPAQIQRWLLLAQSLRAPVSLRGLPSGRGASCLILACDASRHCFWLDAPEQPAPPAGTMLTLSVRIDGALVEFRAAFEQRHSAGRWQLALPQRLYCLQRRAALRIRCDDGAARARVHDGELLSEGQLLDLSELGAGLRLPGLSGFPVGSQLRFELELGALVLSTDTELRSTLRILRGTRLGLRFLQLTPGQLQRLQHQIFRWHRDRVRTLPA